MLEHVSFFFFLKKRKTKQRGKAGIITQSILLGSSIIPSMNSRELEGIISSASGRASSCVIPIVLLGRALVVAHGSSDRRVSADEGNQCWDRTEERKRKLAQFLPLPNEFSLSSKEVASLVGLPSWLLDFLSMMVKAPKALRASTECLSLALQI
jgi:hypothetical protein